MEGRLVLIHGLVEHTRYITTGNWFGIPCSEVTWPHHLIHFSGYVVYEVTGSNLEDYALSEAFPALGIDEGDYWWWPDNSGVTNAFW